MKGAGGTDLMRGQRIDDAAGNRSQVRLVKDQFRTFRCRAHDVEITNVAFHHLNFAPHSTQVGHVAGTEIIQYSYLVTAGHEGIHEMGTNEPTATGHKTKTHGE